MKTLTLEELVGRGPDEHRRITGSPAWIDRTIKRIIGTLTADELSVLKLRYKDDAAMLRRIEEARK